MRVKEEDQAGFLNLLILHHTLLNNGITGNTLELIKTLSQS